MYVDSLACVRVKEGGNEWFMIDSGVRLGCIMMKELKMRMGRRGENGDDLVLCGELEEDLRVMVEWFVEVCRRKGLKFDAGKSKVMAMNGEEEWECEVHKDGVMGFV